MRTYDISVTISPDLPTWPGDPGVDVRRVEKIEDGWTWGFIPERMSMLHSTFLKKA